MKLPSKQLQIAYYTALNGNITYGGSNVPVYDVVPQDATYPYIVLADQVVTDRPTTKDSYITDVIMQVDVVTGFEGAYGGKSMMYDISDSVIDIIRTRAPYISLTGFNLFKSTLDIASVIVNETETHILYINRIRFRHLIEEL
jgi:hypothetical protein